MLLRVDIHLRKINKRGYCARFMKSAFKIELKAWMKNALSPYCIKSCKNSCCDCSKEGDILLDPGHEHLFKTFKLNGRKVPFRNDGFKNGPHLYKDNLGHWYFTGGICPNYDPKDKKCMIHNQHPMCALFPLVKEDGGYRIVSACGLHKMDINQEPLKSLIEIFKKHGLKLIK
jgi:Fe-S-cluster containining protein